MKVHPEPNQASSNHPAEGSGRGEGRGLKDLIRKLDMFSESVPQFQLNNKAQFTTFIGGIVSLAFMIVTFLFATVKFQELVTRHNPTINTYTLKNEYSSDDKMDLGDNSYDFNYAFGLVSVAGKPFNDPRFVKWLATYVQIKNDG